MGKGRGEGGRGMKFERYSDLLVENREMFIPVPHLYFSPGQEFREDV